MDQTRDPWLIGESFIYYTDQDQASLVRAAKYSSTPTLKVKIYIYNKSGISIKICHKTKIHVFMYVKHLTKWILFYFRAMHSCVIFVIVLLSFVCLLFPLVYNCDLSMIYTGARMEQRYCSTIVNEY